MTDLTKDRYLCEEDVAYREGPLRTEILLTAPRCAGPRSGVVPRAQAQRPRRSRESYAATALPREPTGGGTQLPHEVLAHVPAGSNPENIAVRLYTAQGKFFR